MTPTTASLVIAVLAFIVGAAGIVFEIRSHLENRRVQRKWRERLDEVLQLPPPEDDEQRCWTCSKNDWPCPEHQDG